MLLGPDEPVELVYFETLAAAIDWDPATDRAEREPTQPRPQPPPRSSDAST